jgi:hypothetical protein
MKLCHTIIDSGPGVVYAITLEKFNLTPLSRKIEAYVQVRKNMGTIAAGHAVKSFGTALRQNDRMRLLDHCQIIVVRHSPSTDDIFIGLYNGVERDNHWKVLGVW